MKFSLKYYPPSEEISYRVFSEQQVYDQKRENFVTQYLFFGYTSRADDAISMAMADARKLKLKMSVHRFNSVANCWEPYAEYDIPEEEKDKK